MSEKKTIVLLQGHSQYELLELFLLDAADGFRTLGYNVIIVKLTEPTAGQILNQAVGSGDVLFFMSVNTVYSSLTMGDKLLFDAVKIPVVSWYVDHLYHHAGRTPSASEYLLVGMCDQGHINYFEQWRPALKKPFFLPHAAKMPDEKHPVLPISQREIPVLFLGSGGNPKTFEENLYSSDPEINTLVQNVLKAVLFETKQPFWETFLSVLAAQNISFDRLKAQFSASEMENIFRNIDFYVRLHRRTRVIEAIKSTPLCLFGKNWSYRIQSQPNVHFVGDIAFSQTAELMANSQLMLNVLPAFHHGLHDRLVYAMAGSTPCLTDINPYLEAQFPPEKAAFYYEWDNLDAIDDQIQALLANPQQLEAVAQEGKRIVLERHTWQVRCQEIIDQVKNQFYRD